jgi:hypothetical protein
LKGERLASRALVKRLKEWTPVLVLKEKPDARYARTFKDETVVLVIADHKPAESEQPIPPPGAKPER